MTTQEEADKIIKRCRQAVSKFGQGSDKLQELERLYKMFYSQPNDDALVFILKEELKKLGV